jgi:mRNA-degrading endonuclease RelE of RelBE toxin-antitoxin system
MTKLLTVVPADRTPPLCQFFGELEEKQRQKMLTLFTMLLQSPTVIMREPYVKHFSLERYHALYELRAKSKTLVRIIFSITDEGDVLFLTPFIKRRKRDTMQALDSALDLLAQVKDGSCSIEELSIQFFINGGNTL